ncbi:ATP-binding protein, partial [Pseudonocardia sp. KRD291]|uniref:ATP-binding protein n=1 Tax=Pseudonocardia sp. KRD291 TaxID=2792007 RepID=UPI001C4A046A
ESAALPEPAAPDEHLADHHPAQVPMPDALRLAVHRVDGDLAQTTDWFGTLVLPGGRTALVVGSLPGPGADVPVVVGALRAVLAEALRDGEPLSGAVRRADAAAARFAPGHGATLTAVVVDPPARTVEYVCRGHYPPVLCDGSGSAPLDGATGGPLGLGAPPVRPGRTTISAGAALVLCSAGLVERPGQPVTAGLTELADTVRGSWQPTDSPAAADALCARILDRLRTNASGVLMAATVPCSVPDALDTEIEADPAGIVGLRERLEDWLRDAGVPADTLAAVPIVVSELVTNSVQHAYPPGSTGPVRVHAARDNRPEVAVTVSDDGAWTPPRDGRGFGLAVARELSDALTVDSGSRGTTVRARFGLSRPVVTRDSGPRLHVAGPGFGMLTAGDPPTRICVHGPVDPAAAQDLHSAMLYATAGGTRALTLDLSDVTVLGPAAVRVLHEFTGYADPTPSVRAPEGSVARAMLALSGLATLLDDSPDLEADALELHRIR